MPQWTKRFCLRFATIALSLFCSTAGAAELKYVSGIAGNALQTFRALVEPWEKETGHTVTLVPMPASTTEQFAQYRLWLAAGVKDIDLYQTDVIWAPQLANQFVDLTEAAGELAPLHFPSIIKSQTVDGKLVSIPIYTDAPALYYRSDLLEKYEQPIPKKWDELTQVAKIIQDRERADGNDKIWGFVWQAAAYEGLTCVALEWIKSHGGGQIIEVNGSVSVNNSQTVRAFERAASWLDTISPKGVLAYREEEVRGIWQGGYAVFMRNWPYAYGLSASNDSAVKSRFGVTRLPMGEDGGVSAATLGGWNVAVSKYSRNREAAVSLALYLGSPEAQKRRALLDSRLPTLMSLYDDPEIVQQVPIIPQWKDVFLTAVPRPSAVAKVKYNEASSKIWTAVHDTLSGKGTASENLELLEFELEELKGSAW